MKIEEQECVNAYADDKLQICRRWVGVAEDHSGKGWTAEVCRMGSTRSAPTGFQVQVCQYVGAARPDTRPRQKGYESWVIDTQVDFGPDEYEQACNYAVAMLRMLESTS